MTTSLYAKGVGIGIGIIRDNVKIQCENCKL